MQKRKRRITDSELIALYQPPTIGHIDEKYDVYIGDGDPERGLQPSVWSNPYSLRYFGLEGGLEIYEAYLRERPQYMQMIDSLKGKVLGCTCRTSSQVDTGRPCHGDSIRKIYLEKCRRGYEESPDF